MSALQALRIHELDAIDLPDKSTTRKGIRQNQFGLKFKLKIFQLMRNAGITDTELSSKDVNMQRKLNQ